MTTIGIRTGVKNEWEKSKGTQIFLDALRKKSCVPFSASSTGGTVSGLTSLALTAAANANPISLTGYSLTGSNAQPLLDLAGTQLVS